MITLASPATLHGNYAHIYDQDSALRSDAPDFADQYGIWIETGSADALSAITVPGSEPTVFQLRHFRGRVRAELHSIIRPTLVGGEVSHATYTRIAELAIAGIDPMPKAPTEDGPRALEFVDHPAYGFKVLAPRSFDLLCDVGGGALIIQLGFRAFADWSSLPGK